MAAPPKIFVVDRPSAKEAPAIVKPEIINKWRWFGWYWWLWGCWLAVWTRCQPFFALTWMFLAMACTSYNKQEKILKAWLEKEVPTQPVKDLVRDLSDGVILCGLMETLVPGTCPRHDLLSHDQPGANLRLASRLAFSYLGVTQGVSETEGEYDTRVAIINFLKAVRYAALRRQLLGGLPVNIDTVAQTLGDHQVLGRGMGLQMAVVGRKARFALYLNNPSGLDLVVEIKSERGDYCSHHITHRSPCRSRSTSDKKMKERHNIPLEYEVTKSEIRVSWIPLQQSRHILAIIWKGQHILGSPYTVTVDESQHNSPGPRRQFLRPLHNKEEETVTSQNVLAVTSPKSAAPTTKGQAGALRFMSILRRKVVRRVVHVGDRDVVLKGNESIGISSRARQAFQRIRSVSHESTDDESTASRTHDDDDAQPNASLKQLYGDRDTEWMLQGRISPHPGDWSPMSCRSPCRSPESWTPRSHFSPRTTSSKPTRNSGTPTDL